MEKLMKPEEVQEILAVSKNTLGRIVASGDLPVIRVKGQLRYLPSDVEAYIRRNREQVIPKAPAKRGRPKKPEPITQYSRVCTYVPGMKVV